MVRERNATATCWESRCRRSSGRSHAQRTRGGKFSSAEAPCSRCPNQFRVQAVPMTVEPITNNAPSKRSRRRSSLGYRCMDRRKKRIRREFTPAHAIKHDSLVLACGSWIVSLPRQRRAIHETTRNYPKSHRCSFLLRPLFHLTAYTLCFVLFRVVSWIVSSILRK